MPVTSSLCHLRLTACRLRPAASRLRPAGCRLRTAACRLRPAVVLALSAGLLGYASPAAVAAGTSADANRAAAHKPALDSRGPGYLRLADLTPGRRPVDVYMYSFGQPGAAVVFRHLGHGTVSRYRAVASGDYTVAVRSAGTAAAAKPVLSATIHVAAGHSYTVAVRPGAVSGFGAAAPKPARSLAVWLVLAFAGLLASVAGVTRFRQFRWARRVAAQFAEMATLPGRAG